MKVNIIGGAKRKRNVLDPSTGFEDTSPDKDPDEVDQATQFDPNYKEIGLSHAMNGDMGVRGSSTGCFIHC